MAAPMWTRRLLRPALGARGESRRKHAGAVHPGVLQLPPALARAAQSLLQEEGWSREQAEALGTRLWGHRPPELWGAEKTQQNPEPQVRYTAELARAYLAVRLERDHAAVGRALHEIRLRAPAFTPHTLLDFGSGLGTACWAAHELWGRSLRQFLCVGTATAMRELGERLRHGGAATGPAHFGPVLARPSLPAEHKVQWDLVVGCYALGGLRGREARAGIVRGLWRRSATFLVLVEHGTRAGHRLLMEARDVLLQDPDGDSVEIFAPCPHRQPCPRLRQDRACAFAQRYQPLPLHGHPPDPARELVSFLITRRVGSPASVTPPEESVMTSPEDLMTSPPGGWARVTAPVHPRPRHVPLSLCCPDGALRRMTVTAARHGRLLYRQARASRWGDLLPLPGDVESDVTPTKAIKSSEK
ncbi:methyltransferase-like protein 17, mitochondrial [Numida meleagris]|uniref:methyltransferase-like protein 17, mitochondrial n=1 Tax=Numida meleagris TaxID=8996 RepID=UPI000B3DA840|nr:methyltransferase-like protein 17, mitochondrial [Numida meleagris]